MGCCTKRKEDGTIDRGQIDRAVLGLSAVLSPTEVKLVTFRLAKERKWGLKRIAAHVGYSNSVIGEILARQRGAR